MTPAELVASEIGVRLGIEAAAPAPGGCIHRCYRVRIGSRERFLKVNDGRFADAFAAEADGLAAMRSAGARAPQAIAQGAAGGLAYLLLEHLALRASGRFAALGAMLARMHRARGSRYGWHRDNYIGSTPQANAGDDDWRRFWEERRLRPQLDLARANGFELAAEGVSALLEGHRPEPSLLHGDLWSGNAGFVAEGPVLFDPAVYYGDREADLALTELFGGFPAEFYEGYRSEYPLDKGYEARKHVYNLYHLLNHLNLFGGGYLAQVNATLGLLLRRL